MNGIGYIYKITNIIDGKIYVGKTKKTIDIRYKSHLKTAQQYKEIQKTSSQIYNAINKYGVENFTIEQLEECPYEILSEREKFWINKLDARNPDTGYNICSGGEGGPGGPMFSGHHHTDETKARMSADRTGEKNANYGNRWKQSDELKALHSRLSSGEVNGMYGKSHSDETKRKIGLANSQKCWVTDDVTDIRINKDDLELYLMAGYRQGRKFVKKK